MDGTSALVYPVWCEGYKKVPQYTQYGVDGTRVSWYKKVPQYPQYDMDGMRVPWYTQCGVDSIGMYLRIPSMVWMVQECLGIPSGVWMV